VTKLKELSLDPVLQRLSLLLSDEANPVYFVGGTVRDLALGRVIHDIDLAVDDDAIPLMFRLARELGYPAFVMDKERHVGRILGPGHESFIDVAQFREPELGGDLLGRDFTMNAMALPVNRHSLHDIIDPHGGLSDIEQGTIRVVHPRSIAEDPVRALRGVRFAAELRFVLAPEVIALSRDAAGIISERASPERIRDEISRILLSGQPDAGIAMLNEMDLLAAVLPAVSALEGVRQSAPHHQDALAHTMTVLNYLTQLEWLVYGEPVHEEWVPEIESLVASYRVQLRDHLDARSDGGASGRLLLLWAGLLHDVGKRQTQSITDDGRIQFYGHDKVGAAIASAILSGFSFSNEATNRVRAIVGGHMRPLLLANERKAPGRRAIFRYYRALRGSGLDVALLSLADHLATYDGVGDSERWESLLVVVGSLFHNYFDYREQTVAPRRLLNGKAVMELLEEPAGHEIGRLLGLLEEAQAVGEVSTVKEAEEFVRLNHVK
jgi:poly(A) polymerase/tRNA nucleotidyltransferase (CCA-adding enzyme)